MKQFYIYVYTLVITFGLAVSASAQNIPFQGRILESGEPLTGSVELVFEIADITWTETHPAVNVQNGVYSVELGSITPLPKSLFYQVDSRTLSISVNGTALAPITIFAPFGKSSIDEDLAEGKLIMRAPNDSLNVRMGGITNDYQGQIYLHDSTGVSSMFLISRQLGGYMDIFKRDINNNLMSGVVAASQERQSFLYLMGQNYDQTGRSVLVNHYNTPRAIAGGPFYSDSYMRSGSDWSDNQGRLLAAIGNAREEAGPDPTGAAGFLTLWGTNSANAQLTGKRWQNHDLPTFELYGTTANNDGWWVPNLRAEVNLQNDTSYSHLSLQNTANGGFQNETVFLTSNAAESGFALLDLRDAAGNTRVRLMGDGLVASINPTGQNAANFFQSGTGDGGIAVQNAANQNKFFYSAADNTLTLRGPSFESNVVLNGENGDVTIAGTLTAQTLTELSDQRLKTNIQPLTNTLQGVQRLRPVSYQWKNTSLGQERQIGLIAQELEVVYPEFVHTDAVGTKSVNYSQMVALLIEAVKELDLKIAALEKENQGLKAENNQLQNLESKLNELQKMVMQLTETTQSVSVNKLGE